MGIWSKIKKLFGEVEPQAGEIPTPASEQAPAQRPGKIPLDPSLIQAPPAGAQPPAGQAISIATSLDKDVGELGKKDIPLDAMGSMSKSMAAAKMGPPRSAAYLTPEMIARMNKRKSEYEIEQQKWLAKKAAMSSANAQRPKPPAFPAGKTVVQAGPKLGQDAMVGKIKPTPIQAAPIARPAPSMANQAPVSSMGDRGRYGNYRNDDDSLLFQMMYPELGVWRNPASMQAWAVWMLTREHGDNHFHCDGFKATVIDGHSGSRPVVQVVGLDGKVIEAKCELSEGKMTVCSAPGQTATFDFGVDAKSDILFEGGDGRGFDWGMDKGISASVLADSWDDRSTSRVVEDSSRSSYSGAGVFDSGRMDSGSVGAAPETESWNSGSAAPAPVGGFDAGPAVAASNGGWESAPTPSGEFDAGPTPTASNGGWDNAPSPSVGETEPMVTAY